MRTPPWLTAWGILGVTGLLSWSVIRLSRPVLEMFEIGLTPFQTGLMVIWCIFMVYAEAYKGFHKQFCPRVVTRAYSIPVGRPWLALFAPFVSTGLLHATKKRRIISTCLILGVWALVMVVRALPQPWRGIVDAGVVLGLGGGTLSLVFHAVRSLFGIMPDADPEWPEPAVAADPTR